MPILTAVWEDLSLDFITGLPKYKGYEVVLVVVDRLSKYSHFILLKHPYTAKSTAEVFVREVVRLHGIPSSVISDRDSMDLPIGSISNSEENNGARQIQLRPQAHTTSTSGKISTTLSLAPLESSPTTI